MVHIGLRIKYLMDKENLKPDQLGEKLKLSGQAVRDMTQREDVHTKHLRKLSKIFNVPMTYFVSENLSPAECKSRDLMQLCKSLVVNYQQRDKVMSQLVSMVETVESDMRENGEGKIQEEDEDEENENHW